MLPIWCHQYKILRSIGLLAILRGDCTVLQEDAEDILNIFGSTPEEDEAMRLLEASFAEDDDLSERLTDEKEVEADGLEKVIGKNAFKHTVRHQHHVEHRKSRLGLLDISQRNQSQKPS